MYVGNKSYIEMQQITGEDEKKIYLTRPILHSPPFTLPRSWPVLSTPRYLSLSNFIEYAHVYWYYEVQVLRVRASANSLDW